MVNKMGEDARDIVIQLVPFAFRISLSVVFVDSRHKDVRVSDERLKRLEPANGGVEVPRKVRGLLSEPVGQLELTR